MDEARTRTRWRIMRSGVTIDDMKIGIMAATMIGGMIIGGFRVSRAMESVAPQAPSPASRSVWDGVYTEAQQKRGEAIYSRDCSTCHGEKLRGGEGSPGLAGTDFAASYGGQTVADVFEKIRLTMPAPPDQPGKLSPQQNADVVAHILGANGFPAGKAELPTDAAQLQQIRIVIKP